MKEETRPLQFPTRPCPHCGSKQFIIWSRADDPNNQAISCDGAVVSSTHPLDDHERPVRRPR